LEQRTALLTIIDRNADLRKIAKLPPGVYEKLQAPIISGSLESSKNRSNAQMKIETHHNSIFTGQFSGMAQAMMDSADDLESENMYDNNAQEFYQSKYPLQEPVLVGESAPIYEQPKALKKATPSVFTTKDLPTSLANNNDDEMEAAALREMKKGLMFNLF
jgi:hypothetical protein